MPVQVETVKREDIVSFLSNIDVEFVSHVQFAANQESYKIIKSEDEMSLEVIHAIIQPLGKDVTALKELYGEDWFNRVNLTDKQETDKEVTYIQKSEESFDDSAFVLKDAGHGLSFKVGRLKKLKAQDEALRVPTLTEEVVKADLSAQDAAKQIVTVSTQSLNDNIKQMKDILAACDKAAADPDVKSNAKKMSQLDEMRTKANHALDILTHSKDTIDHSIDYSKISEDAAPKLNAALAKAKAKVTAKKTAKFDDGQERDENGRFASGGGGGGGGSSGSGSDRSTSDAMRQGGSSTFWKAAPAALGLSVAAVGLSVASVACPPLAPAAIAVGLAAHACDAVATASAAAWLVGFVAGGKKKGDSMKKADPTQISDILTATTGTANLDPDPMDTPIVQDTDEVPDADDSPSGMPGDMGMSGMGIPDDDEPEVYSFGDLFYSKLNAFSSGVVAAMELSEDPKTRRTAIRGFWTSFGNFLNSALDRVDAVTMKTDMQCRHASGKWTDSKDGGFLPGTHQTFLAHVNGGKVKQDEAFDALSKDLASHGYTPVAASSGSSRKYIDKSNNEITAVWKDGKIVVNPADKPADKKSDTGGFDMSDLFATKEEMTQFIVDTMKTALKEAPATGVEVPEVAKTDSQPDPTAQLNEKLDKLAEAFGEFDAIKSEVKALTAKTESLEHTTGKGPSVAEDVTLPSTKSLQSTWANHPAFAGK